MRTMRCALLGLLIVGIVVPVCAAPAAPAAAWTLDVAVLNSAAQAWDLAGKNDQVYTDMVRQMAALAAANRGLSLPNQKELGEMVGQIVARDVKTDPDKLLYAIVDHAVVTGMGSMVPASLSMPVETEKALPDWDLTDAVTSTVRQAWDISGQSHPELMKMVNQLVALDLENRGWSLPDTDVAGSRFGNILLADMEAHPNDLLYSAVDRSLAQTIALSLPPVQ